MDHISTTHIFLMIIVLVSLKGFNDRAFTDKYLFKPYEISHRNEWYRSLSHAFLHSDSMHLIFNGITLYFFAPFVEMTYIAKYGQLNGTLFFVAFFILSALFSTIIPFVRHKDNPSYRSLGASGIAAAMIFAVILLAPNTRFGFFFIPIGIPAYIFGPLYLAFEIYADRKGNTGIAHDAHIGGALFGILFVLITNIEAVKTSINSFLQ